MFLQILIIFYSEALDVEYRLAESESLNINLVGLCFRCDIGNPFIQCNSSTIPAPTIYPAINTNYTYQTNANGNQAGLLVSNSIFYAAYSSGLYLYNISDSTNISSNYVEYCESPPMAIYPFINNSVNYVVSVENSGVIRIINIDTQQEIKSMIISIDVGTLSNVQFYHDGFNIWTMLFSEYIIMVKNDLVKLTSVLHRNFTKNDFSINCNMLYTVFYIDSFYFLYCDYSGISVYDISSVFSDSESQPIYVKTELTTIIRVFQSIYTFSLNGNLLNLAGSTQGYKYNIVIISLPDLKVISQLNYYDNSSIRILSTLNNTVLAYSDKIMIFNNSFYDPIYTTSIQSFGSYLFPSGKLLLINLKNDFIVYSLDENPRIKFWPTNQPGMCKVEIYDYLNHQIAKKINVISSNQPYYKIIYEGEIEYYNYIYIDSIVDNKISGYVPINLYLPGSYPRYTDDIDDDYSEIISDYSLGSEQSIDLPVRNSIIAIQNSLILINSEYITIIKFMESKIISKITINANSNDTISCACVNENLLIIENYKKYGENYSISYDITLLNGSFIASLNLTSFNPLVLIEPSSSIQAQSDYIYMTSKIGLSVLKYSSSFEIVYAWIVEIPDNPCTDATNCLEGICLICNSSLVYLNSVLNTTCTISLNATFLNIYSAFKYIFITTPTKFQRISMKELINCELVYDKYPSRCSNIPAIYSTSMQFLSVTCAGRTYIIDSFAKPAISGFTIIVNNNAEFLLASDSRMSSEAYLLKNNSIQVVSIGFVCKNSSVAYDESIANHWAIFQLDLLSNYWIQDFDIYLYDYSIYYKNSGVKIFFNFDLNLTFASYEAYSKLIRSDIYVINKNFIDSIPIDIKGFQPNYFLKLNNEVIFPSENCNYYETICYLTQTIDHSFEQIYADYFNTKSYRSGSSYYDNLVTIEDNTITIYISSNYYNNKYFTIELDNPKKVAIYDEFSILGYMMVNDTQPVLFYYDIWENKTIFKNLSSEPKFILGSGYLADNELLFIGNNEYLLAAYEITDDAVFYDFENRFIIIYKNGCINYADGSISKFESFCFPYSFVSGIVMNGYIYALTNNSHLIRAWNGIFQDYLIPSPSSKFFTPLYCQPVSCLNFLIYPMFTSNTTGYIRIVSTEDFKVIYDYNVDGLDSSTNQVVGCNQQDGNYKIYYKLIDSGIKSFVFRRQTVFINQIYAPYSEMYLQLGVNCTNRTYLYSTTILHVNKINPPIYMLNYRFSQSNSYKIDLISTNKITSYTLTLDGSNNGTASNTPKVILALNPFFNYNISSEEPQNILLLSQNIVYNSFISGIYSYDFSDLSNVKQRKIIYTNNQPKYLHHVSYLSGEFLISVEDDSIIRVLNLSDYIEIESMRISINMKRLLRAEFYDDGIQTWTVLYNLTNMIIIKSAFSNPYYSTIYKILSLNDFNNVVSSFSNAIFNGPNLYFCQLFSYNLNYFSLSQTLSNPSYSPILMKRFISYQTSGPFISCASSQSHISITTINEVLIYEFPLVNLITIINQSYSNIQASKNFTVAFDNSKFIIYNNSLNFPTYNGFLNVSSWILSMTSNLLICIVENNITLNTLQNPYILFQYSPNPYEYLGILKNNINSITISAVVSDSPTFINYAGPYPGLPRQTDLTLFSNKNFNLFYFPVSNYFTSNEIQYSSPSYSNSISFRILNDSTLKFEEKLPLDTSKYTFLSLESYTTGYDSNNSLIFITYNDNNIEKIYINTLYSSIKKIAITSHYCFAYYQDASSKYENIQIYDMNTNTIVKKINPLNYGLENLTSLVVHNEVTLFMMNNSYYSILTLNTTFDVIKVYGHDIESLSCSEAVYCDGFCIRCNEELFYIDDMYNIHFLADVQSNKIVATDKYLIYATPYRSNLDSIYYCPIESIKNLQFSYSLIIDHCSDYDLTASHNLFSVRCAKNILIYDTYSEAFSMLFTNISISSDEKFQLALDSYLPAVSFLFSSVSNLVTKIIVGNSFQSRMVPLNCNIALHWAEIKMNYYERISNTYIKIYASSPYGEDEQDLTIELINQAFIVFNRDFSYKSSQLTYGSTTIQNKLLLSVPEAFLGNNIEYILLFNNSIILPSLDCNEYENICIDSRLVPPIDKELQKNIQADEFSINGNTIAVSFGQILSLYNLRNGEFLLNSSINSIQSIKFLWLLDDECSLIYINRTTYVIQLAFFSSCPSATILYDINIEPEWLTVTQVDNASYIYIYGKSILNLYIFSDLRFQLIRSFLIFSQINPCNLVYAYLETSYSSIVIDSSKGVFEIFNSGSAPLKLFQLPKDSIIISAKMLKSRLYLLTDTGDLFVVNPTKWTVIDYIINSYNLNFYTSFTLMHYCHKLRLLSYPIFTSENSGIIRVVDTSNFLILIDFEAEIIGNQYGMKAGIMNDSFIQIIYSNSEYLMYQGLRKQTVHLKHDGKNFKTELKLIGRSWNYSLSYGNVSIDFIKDDGEREEEEHRNKKIEWWIWVVIGGGTLILIIGLIFVIKYYRKRKAKARKDILLTEKEL